MAVKPSQPKLSKLEMLRQRLKEVDLGGGNQGFWSPPVGSTVVRILPPVGHMEFFFQEVGRHYFPDGKYVMCPSFTTNKQRECPICEIVSQLYSAGDKASKKLAGELGKRRQYWVNVIVRGKDGADDTGPFIMTPGKTIFDALINIIQDPDYGDITDLDNGFDVTIKRVGQKLETEYDVICKPRPSPLSDDPDQMQEWLDTAKNLAWVELTDDPDEDRGIIGDSAVWILPYDRLVNENGLDDFNIDPDAYEQQQEEQPKRNSKPVTKRKPVVEEVEEEDVEEEEVEEAPRKPAARQVVERKRVVRR